MRAVSRRRIGRRASCRLNESRGGCGVELSNYADPLFRQTALSAKHQLLHGEVGERAFWLMVGENDRGARPFLAFRFYNGQEPGTHRVGRTIFGHTEHRPGSSVAVGDTAASLTEPYEDEVKRGVSAALVPGSGARSVSCTIRSTTSPAKSSLLRRSASSC
jgi:hypothetical protein